MLQRFEFGYDPKLVTKLLYNYRSLPSILNAYSDLFYKNELRPMVSDKDSDELTMLKRVNVFFASNENRPPNHGLYFVGVRGEDRRLPDSPSWFNGAEAKSVCTSS